MVKFRHWRDSRGLACMIDVEFVTLGIIRCNIGDSVKCKIAFERVGGNRKQFDSSLCFMVSCWSFSVLDI